MKRKAVLIESSNVTNQKDLPGARVDVENWQNFLKSSLGGSWGSSEIVVLRKPLSTELEKELQVSFDTYCFVAFSGHGAEGSIALNDYRDDYPVSKLRPTGERGAIIVDSCRGVSHGRYSFGTHAVALANAFEGRSVIALNATEGRSTMVVESAIRNRMNALRTLSGWESGFGTIKGIVEMLACSKGQAAGEDVTAGGYYTSLLLESADVWSKSNSSAPFHSTREAHEYAKRMLPAQQTPEYAPNWLAYPFAVRA